MEAIPVKTLAYLVGSAEREIVAGKYLHDGRLMLIDRKNSVLLITNTTDETTQEIHLEVSPSLAKRESSCETLGFVRVPNLELEPGSNKNEEEIEPSDVNNGFDDDQLLITFTGGKFSFGVIYTTETKQNELVLEKTLTFKVDDRPRSIVVLGKDHLCADTHHYTVIFNRSGVIKYSHCRRIPDRGGLLMSDGESRFFYGDGHEYIGKKWDGENVEPIFEFSDQLMKRPRGSVIDGLGEIIVCCDLSHNIFRISPDGKKLGVIESDETKAFGDIDLQPNGKVFVTTVWGVDQFPILFPIKA